MTLYLQPSLDTKIEVDMTLEDSRCDISNKFYNVCVIETEQGLIVDVYDPNGELLRTNTYWNEDYEDEDI